MPDMRAGLQYYAKKFEKIAIEPTGELQEYKKYSSSLLEVLEAKNPPIVQRFELRIIPW